MKKHYLIIALAFATTFTACKKDESDANKNNYTDVLNKVSDDVILATYSDLSLKAALLKQATTTLETAPTTANLDAAKTAWVNARKPWEQSEGFLFGPVDQAGIDPALDSWPVNIVDLENVLNSGNAITPAFLQAQDGTLKGFHTIEFLLWGSSSNKQVTDFTAREFEYLAAAATVLASDAKTLYDMWQPASGNFIAQVQHAGHGSNIYISQKAAIEEMTSALVIIADEVGNGKINEPFSQSDLSLEESRFSANSKTDFADNMRSIQNIYTGTYGAMPAGNGIGAIIQSKNNALHQQVLTHINNAITSIEAIPGTFSDAVNVVAKAKAIIR